MDKEHQGSRYQVLLVDDSDDDRYFLRRSFAEEGRLDIVCELTGADDAIAYLAGREKFADRNEYPVPDLMLLDLKMPGRSGHDVLEWLQNQPGQKPIVVVLTNSILPEDLQRSLDLGASAYHVKTAERGGHRELIRALENLLDASVGRLRNL